jgi:hypothetical protein
VVGKIKYREGRDVVWDACDIEVELAEEVFRE